MNRALVLALGLIVPAVANAQNQDESFPAQRALRYTGGVTQRIDGGTRLSGNQIPISLDAQVGMTSLVCQPISPVEAVLFQPLKQTLPGLMPRNEIPAVPDALVRDHSPQDHALDSSLDGPGCYLDENQRGRFRAVSGCDEEPANNQPDDFFHTGQFDIAFVSGFIGVNLGPKTNVPFDMVPELVRVGCIWNDPHPERLVSGCWEGIWELDTMPVVDGPASIVIGSSLLIRYHYLKRRMGRVVPYLQYGGGGMYTNAYLRGSPVLSSGFEFILQTGIGVNIFLNNRWALTAEWNYYHFSNGGMVLPNVSVNMMGGLIGLTYYIGRK